MSLNLTDAAAALRGLLRHNIPCSGGVWMIERVAHPTELATFRLVFSCTGCGAGHMYDGRPVPRAEVQADVDAKVRLLRPLLSVVRP